MKTCSTEKLARKKRKELTFEKRKVIETLYNKEHKSFSAIAREIGCRPTTISVEIKRGTVSLPDGTTKPYDAIIGQEIYERNKRARGRKCMAPHKQRFLNFVEEKLREENWPLKKCIEYALESGMFKKEDVVSWYTLYRYIKKGIIIR